MAECREAESLAVLIWGKIVYEQARGAHIVMGQEYLLGRRGLSRSRRTWPNMANKEGTTDQSNNLGVRSWCCAPLHGAPSPPWKPLSTVTLSQALAVPVLRYPHFTMGPPRSSSLQRFNRLMDQPIQSVNHSLIPSVWLPALPACPPGLLAISELLPARPNFHQLEERKEPSCTV